MKKKFLILIPIFLFLQSIVFGAEGDCYKFTQTGGAEWETIVRETVPGCSMWVWDLPYFDETLDEFIQPPQEHIGELPDGCDVPSYLSNTGISLYAYKWDDINASWILIDTHAIVAKTYYVSDPSSFASWPENPPTGEGCPQDCNDEYQAKIQECDGEQYIINWDDQACTGDCDTCSQKYDNLVATCGVEDDIIWDAVECKGYCNNKNLGECQ